MKLGKIGVWQFLDAMPASAAADAAKKIEALGYSALWIPEAIGRHPFAAASWLLANTSDLIVATGIANVYHREPGVTRAGQMTLAEQSGGRFLLGLGVSHKPLVEGLRGLTYGKPLETMRSYLQAMAAAPYASVSPEGSPPVVIAALGPKMLELARESADGAHPYFVSPEHTREARRILGENSWLCVEQKVVLESDMDKARAAARAALAIYSSLPNYRNNWKRMGFHDADIDQGGSDALLDATFAMGGVAELVSRVEAHLDAGASHVCVQAIDASGGPPGTIDWDALEAVSKALL